MSIVNQKENKAYHKAYNLAHKKEIAANKRAHYLAHKKEVNARSKVYRLANKKEMAEYHKAYRLANPKKVKIRQKACYQKRAEKYKNRARLYQQAHPEVGRLHDRKRRALKRGVQHNPYATSYVFERDNWICQICGRKINRRLKYPHPRSGSIDHIIPLSKGGNDAPINVQATHLRCNLGKHAINKGQLRLFG